MNHLSEEQKILINKLFDLIAHDDALLEKIASEIEVEQSELEMLVNVEF